MNEHTELVEAEQLFDTRPVTEDDVAEIMKSLGVDTATGPDGIPARALKVGKMVLAGVLAELAEKCIASREWPELWKQHWVVPLRKKQPFSNPANYRGVHLTSIVGKVVERTVLRCTPMLQDPGELHGEHQYAYLRGRGCRDAHVALVLRILQAFLRREHLEVYFADVAAAFDRVSETRLLRKLKSKGAGDRLVGLVEGWLRHRKANVVVGGSQ